MVTGFDFVTFDASGNRLGLKKFKIDGNRGSALACISVKVARLPRDPQPRGAESRIGGLGEYLCIEY